MNYANSDIIIHCNFCNYIVNTAQYKYKAKMHRHVEIIHDNITKYKCDYCHWAFNRRTDAMHHIVNIHHEKRPFKCNLCDYSTVTISDLNKHKKFHSLEKPHKCEKCSFAAYAKHTIKRHHRKVHENLTNYKRYQCKFCDRSSKYCVSELNTHVEKSHDRIARYKCDKCHITFNTKADVKFHLNSYHNGNKPFQCDLCCDSFVKISALIRHKEIYSQVKPHNCEKCSYLTHAKANMNKHLRKTHKIVKPKRYKCSSCTFSTTFINDYKAHLDKKDKCVPNTPGLFKCNKCSFNTHYKGSFLRHQSTKHTDVKPFKCKICSFETKWYSVLKRHLDRKDKCVPKSAGQFKCDKCSFDTDNKSTLKSHQRQKHTDIKPVKCKICSYETKWSATLKRHELIKHPRSNIFQPKGHHSTGFATNVNCIGKKIIGNSTSKDSRYSKSILLPKICLNKNSVDLKRNFGQHQSNEILSTVKVKTERKSDDLIQNYSLETQRVKIEKANFISDTFSSKRLRSSQPICKLEIKKEKKENIPKSTTYLLPSIKIPDVRKNEIELSWFEKFRLKHSKIILENNLNAIINQHIQDPNSSRKVIEKSKQGLLIRKAVNEYKQNYRENSERVDYPRRRYHSQQKRIAKSIKMKTLEILLEKINVEILLPGRSINNQ